MQFLSITSALNAQKEICTIFDEFHGCVKDCKADQYGCDILIDVEGVGIRFETSPRDGIEFANDITGHWRKSESDTRRSGCLVSGNRRAHMIEPEASSGPHVGRWDDAID